MPNAATGFRFHGFYAVKVNAVGKDVGSKVYSNIVGHMNWLTSVDRGRIDVAIRMFSNCSPVSTRSWRC